MQPWKLQRPVLLCDLAVRVEMTEARSFLNKIGMICLGKEQPEEGRTKLCADWFINFHASALAAPEALVAQGVSRLRRSLQTCNANHNALLSIDFSRKTPYRTRIAGCLATLKKVTRNET